MKKLITTLLGLFALATTANSQSACSCYITPDATYTIGIANSDDGSTAAIPLPFTFCFYGVNYTSLYINNNGTVSFGAAYGGFTGFAFPSTAYVLIAPFLADVDTRGTGLVKYKITPTAIYINWEGVGYFSMHTDKVDNFQVIITNGLDPIVPTGNLAICYGDMQWTTGDASGGASTGFGGTAATVGYNAGDGINYLQLGGFNQPGSAYFGSLATNNGINWLDNKSFYFNACVSSNIAPIASGISECDTIKVCGVGDTILINGLFLSPETAQITSLLINLNSTPGASIISNTSGVNALGVVQLISSTLNAGNNVITFTATDNGIPAGVTVVNVNVFVDTSGVSIPNPVITGNLHICPGGLTTLSVIPSIYDTYDWTTGSNTYSTNITAPGMYTCTATLNGCVRMSSVTVNAVPAPTTLIAGYPFTCSGGTTNLYSDSLIYVTYLWTGGSMNDSITAVAGTYYLTVTDAYGCTATAPGVFVSGPLAPVISGQTALCNGATTTVLSTPLSYVSYLWTPSSATSDTLIVGAGTYSLSVVDINGCNLTSAPITIAPFIFNLSVTGNGPYCAGQSTLLIASSSSVPASSPTYQWTPGTGSPFNYAATAGNYSVSVTYPNGCTHDTTIVVATPTPLPTPEVLGNHFNCVGTPTTLYCDSAYVTYSWLGVASTNDSVSVPTGSYEVTVTDVNGCVGTSPVITVVPLGSALLPIYQAGDSLYTLHLTGMNYQWLNCDSSYSIVTGATSQGYLPQHTGSYAVRVNVEGCVDTTACISVTIIHAGVNEVGDLGDVTVYPNPTDSKFQISDSRFKIRGIRMYNILGEVVYQSEILNLKSEIINISSFAPGIYFLEVRTDKGVVNRKIVKQ